MTATITGGINIAMKVPPHQYQATIAFYRDLVGLKPFTAKAPAIGFELGPNRLWIDEAPMLSQAEVWLELFTDDFSKAATHFAEAGVVRCGAMPSSHWAKTFEVAGSPIPPASFTCCANPTPGERRAPAS